MPLEKYRSKRNFARTTEPARGGQRGGKLFVVQLHHARRRHYDFRLEIDGVLKSWAVPKGPSFDPAVKRLAVEVEDHPIAYAKFEGDIAEGNYGAGHVDIFDSGTWQAEGSARAGLEKGELKFSLHGAILRGSWVLVRTRKERGKQQWLLIKHRDAFASDKEVDDYLDPGRNRPPAQGATRTKSRSSPRRNLTRMSDSKPEQIDDGPFAPELCKSVNQSPRGKDWLHEPKWDGYRMLASVARGKVRLWSRNGIEWTDRLPELADALESLGLRSARLDGEIIVLDKGRDSFNALQGRMADENDGEVLYMLFDVIHVDGRSFADVPLIERKRWLATRLADKPNPRLRYSEHEIANGEAVFAQAIKMGLEGVVSKRVDSAYSGARSGAWVKAKSRTSDEFIVVGFTRPKGSRAGIGALLLAKPEDVGLRYVGRVGTGFSADQLLALRKDLDKAIVQQPPADITLMAGRDRHLAIWVKPRLVVEVYFQGIGGRGLLRQPAFKALRRDKKPADLDGETSAKATSAKRGQRSSKRTATGAAKAMKKDIKLTHPDRIVFAGLGRTKGDVADYYRRIAPWMLSEISGRPLSIVRCPDGMGKPCFFQKHNAKDLGEHVRGVSIREKKGRGHYLCVDDASGLLELVQMNAIEFHPWGARGNDPEKADRIVFDLDPHASVTFARVKGAARQLRDHLQSAGLQSFLRTSGGKGLHVVVPLKPAAPWDRVRHFARAVAEVMATIKPDEFVSVSGEKNRKGRIFIDWLRNGRGATSIASYSLRARESAGVAMPLEWASLARLKAADHYTIETAPKWLARRKRDPWEEIDDISQVLPED